MRVHLTSLGCKLNQSEIEMLARRFARAGYQPVSRPELADLCVVNSCTVTHVAARKSRQLIRRLHRTNPNAAIIVTGCYAEMSPEAVRGIEGVALVVGNADKEQLAEIVEPRIGAASTTGVRTQGTPGSPTDCLGIPRVRSEAALPLHSVQPDPSVIRGKEIVQRRWGTEDESLGTEHGAVRAGSRTRALVKIQDGCDNRCTYCIVTLARGQERSRPLSEIIAEVRERVANGHKEVVLTGVNVGAYGRDQATGLARLVRAILDETELPRLRLSSIEPWEVNDELLTLWQDGRLCRHLHLPLQSGCDETLRRMGRRYTAAEYASLVERARAAIPGLAVTTDLIVGFPGETEAEFAHSRQFIEQMAFARLHVFPYSPRRGTPAAQLPGQVPPPVKKRRAQCLRPVGEEADRSCRQQSVGRNLSVLWESTLDSPQVVSGLTDNYLRVYTTSEEKLANTITLVRLTHLHADGLWGQILSH